MKINHKVRYFLQQSHILHTQHPSISLYIKDLKDFEKVEFLLYICNFMNQFDKIHLYVKDGLDDQNRHKLKLSLSYM